MGTQHPVDHHAAHRQLSRIRLASRFAVNQIGQQIPVPVCKAHLRNISPGSVGSRLGHGNLLRQLFPQVLQVFLLLADLLLIFSGFLLRLRYLIRISGNGIGGLADQTGNLVPLRLRVHLQIVQLHLLILQTFLLFLDQCPVFFEFIHLHPLVGSNPLKIICSVQNVRKSPRLKECAKIIVLLPFIHLPDTGYHTLILPFFRRPGFLQGCLGRQDLFLLIPDLRFQVFQVLHYRHKLVIEIIQFSLQTILLPLQTLQILLVFIQFVLQILLVLLCLVDLLLCGGCSHCHMGIRGVKNRPSKKHYTHDCRRFLPTLQVW